MTGASTVAVIDLRVGGRWRYVMVTEDGFDVGFHGEYREVAPNGRIVSTEAFEGDRRGRDNGEHGHLHREGRQDAMNLLEQMAVGLR